MGNYWWTSEFKTPVEWNKYGYEEMAIKDKSRHDRVMQEVPLMEEAKLHEVWQLQAEKEKCSY